MGRRFVRCNGVADILPFDETSARDLLRGLISADNGCLFVAEDDGVVFGMAAALTYPCMWNRSAIVAQELFWWVEPGAPPGHGRALFACLEDWAADVGAVAVTMLAVEAQRPDLVGRVYRRAGYRPMERAHIKRLAS